MTSHWEEMLYQQLKALKLPIPQREVSLEDGRKWRYDFGWLPGKLLVEVHGGTGDFVNGHKVRGSHVSAKGYQSDREKMNSAVMLGYRVLEFTGDHVRSGYAIGFLEKILAETR